MTKRSRQANLGRAARKTAKPRKPRAAPPPDPSNPPAIPGPVELPPEQVIAILHSQVETVRNAFFKLAQARAADRVRFNELSWDQATEYINAEMAGLDQQIASVVPPQ